MFLSSVKTSTKLNKSVGRPFWGSGRPFLGSNFFKISTFSNVLIFGQNVHKGEEKCRETILRGWETILRVNFFLNFKIFKCSYLWPKRPQSWRKMSGDYFEGQGDYFRGQNFSTISKLSNVLIFGQNAHKVEQKCRETILRVRETISRVKICSKFQTFQMFLSLVKTSTKLNKSVGRLFWGSGRPF